MLLKNAMYLAWSDTKVRYRKTVIGPLWLTLGSLIGILGLSVIWATLLNEDLRTFVPSLASGLVIWTLLAGTITDGPTIFIRQAVMIRNVAIPLWFFITRALARQLISFLHNIVIVLGVVWYFDIQLQSTALLAIPGLLIVILNLYWIMLFLAMFGARFHDVEYLINAIMPLLFFISPVIFRADHFPVDMNIIWWNPLSYFIEIIRAPFLGKVPEINVYIVMISMFFVGSIATFFLNRLRGRRVAFWV